MLLSVSAMTLRVKDKMVLICKPHTKARPIMLVLSVPILRATDETPKYPAAAIVKILKRSVTKLIHRLEMF